VVSGLRDALQRLVDLKDGPRDERYYNERIHAWNGAREALAAHPAEPTGVFSNEAEVKAAAVESFAAKVGAWPDDAHVRISVVKALAAEHVAALRAGEPR
jgi:hypothetical protein